MAEQQRQTAQRRNEHPLQQQQTVTWANGRFYHPSQTPPPNPPHTPQNYWDLKNSFLEKTAPTKERFLPRFLAWRLNSVPQEERTDDAIDYQIGMWVDGLPIAPTSKRTYFLSTLSEIGIMWNSRLADTPRLLRIKSYLEKNCAQHVPQRAAIFPLSAIPSIFPRAFISIVQILALCAARVGNACGFRTIRFTEATDPLKWCWTYKWTQHKTLGATGARQVIVNFTKSEFQEAATLLVERLNHSSVITEDEKRELEVVLKSRQMKNHAIRRSGLKYWQLMGLSMEELRSISLHTDQKTLMLYLED
jgi:hypothetical protein